MSYLNFYYLYPDKKTLEISRRLEKLMEEKSVLEARAITFALFYEVKSHVIYNMDAYGGSFVKSLSGCLMTADPKNLQKLLITFPLYILEYLPHKWAKEGGE